MMTFKWLSTASLLITSYSFVQTAVKSPLELRHDDLISKAKKNPDDPTTAFFLGQFYMYEYDCSLDKEGPLCIERCFELFSKARFLVKQGRRVDFNYVGMLNDLGVILKSYGHFSQAKDVYYEAIEMEPTLIPLLVNLAGMESEENPAVAQSLYERAIEQSGSAYPEIFHNYGILMYKANIKDKAQQLWNKAVQLDTRMYLSVSNLATLECERGYVQNAQRLYQEAINTAHTLNEGFKAWSLIFQKGAGGVPMISDSTDHVRSDRTNYISNLINIILNSPKNSIPKPFEAIGCTSLGYYLVYHGFEDHFVRQLQAAVYWRTSFAALSYTAPFLVNANHASVLDEETSLCGVNSTIEQRGVAGVWLALGETEKAAIRSDHTQQRSPPPPARIRVGFLSAFFYHHSVGLLLRGVIKRLDRGLFDVFVLTVNQGPASRDNLTAELTTSNSDSSHSAPNFQGTDGATMKESKDRMIHLKGSLEWIRAEVAALELDVLVFGELGMDTTTYFLSFGRLARRSLVFWGHAVTSGVQGANTAATRMRTNSGEHQKGWEHRSPGPHPSREDTQGGDDATRGGPDYFISSVLFEGVMGEDNSVHLEGSADPEYGRSSCGVTFSQLEYAERLLLMDGLTTFFEYPAMPLTLDELIAVSRASIEGLEGTPDQGQVGAPVPDWIADGVGPKVDVPLHELELLPHWFNGLPSKRSFLLYLDPQLKALLPHESTAFRLYGVPQTLYKLHPDFDHLLAGVLWQDRQGFIVFPRANNEDMTASVLDRMRKSFAREVIAGLKCTSTKGVERKCYPHELAVMVDDFMRRIIFVRQMSSREYVTLCALVDVLLDPFPVGGGRSSLEGLSVGAPIVMMRSRTSILQLTAAMFHVLGLGQVARECCIAHDEQGYIDKAVAMAAATSMKQGDSAINNTMKFFKIEILKRRHLLFENQSVVKEWEKMLLYVSVAPRPKPKPTVVGDISWTSFLEASPDSPRNDQSCKCIASLAEDRLRGTHGQGGETNIKLITMVNPLWREDELRAIIFNYAMPPLFLNRVRTRLGNDFESGEGTPRSRTSADAVRRIRVEAPAEYLCDDVDRSQSTKPDAKLRHGTASSSASLEPKWARTNTNGDPSWNSNSFDKVIAKLQLLQVDASNGHKSGHMKSSEHQYSDTAQLEDEPAPAYRLQQELPPSGILQDGRRMRRESIVVVSSESVLAPGASTSAAPMPSPALGTTVQVTEASTSIFACSFTDEPRNGGPLRQVTIDVKRGDDWRRSCLEQAVKADVDDKLKILYMCTTTGKGVERLQWPTFRSFKLLENNDTAKSIPVDIRLGDDIGHVLHMIQQGKGENGVAQHRELPGAVLGTFAQSVVDEVTSSGVGGSTQWVAQRDRVASGWMRFVQNSSSPFIAAALPGFDLMSPTCPHRDRNNLDSAPRVMRARVLSRDDAISVPPSEEPKDGERERERCLVNVEVVLGMTTCRRLAHFRSTVDALIAAFGSLPNTLITQVIVVDDSSTVDDRTTMKQLYPSFDFIWKNDSQKGHAASMNILVDKYLSQSSRGRKTQLKKRYFMYLEDDWELLARPLLHYSLGHVVDGFNGAVLDGKESAQSHPFEHLLRAAACVMGGGGRSHSAKRLSPAREQIHQVLFNEQASRPCAEGIKGCNLDLIGRGGWARTASVDIVIPVEGSVEGQRTRNGGPFGPNTRSLVSEDATILPKASVAIPYSLHEFGLVGGTAGAVANGDRIHEFTYWPSLSLNPGLWDLDSIWERLASCLQQCTSGVVDVKNYVLGEGGGLPCAIFNESDMLFEHRFSASCLAAGLKMAFFSAVAFRHTGNISAYELNDNRRPWDKP